MSTATAPRIAASPQRFVWRGVGWGGYTALMDLAGDSPAIRLIYDRGDVEIMAPMKRHERPTNRLGFAVEALTEELDIPRFATGSTTYRRRDLDRGLEADESYYLVDKPTTLGEDTIDLTVDRPPDLVVEVDVTSSTLDKLGVYAALGFPEIWRSEDGDVEVLLLGLDARYAASATSAAFPWLPMGEINRALRDPEPNDTRWGREFRAWARAIVLPLYQAWPGP